MASGGGTATVIQDDDDQLPGDDVEQVARDGAQQGMDMAAYRDAVRDEAAAQWHETMMEYEPLVDPNTGREYWAPYNSYDPTSHCESGYELVDGRCLVHQQG